MENRRDLLDMNLKIMSYEDVIWALSAVQEHLDVRMYPELKELRTKLYYLRSQRQKEIQLEKNRDKE